MRRETQNLLLILLGGALLKIAINGDYLRYVKPAQQPWVIAGGAVMVALGVFAVLRDLRRAPDPAGTDPAEHHHPARSAWLLLVPVLAVFLVVPPALGSDSVERAQSRSPQAATAKTTSFPPLPEGPVVPMRMTDFVTRAGWDAGGTLNGRVVALTGFVTHQNGDPVLARLSVSCCAADAYPVTVRLTALPVAYSDDTWLDVTGTVVPDTATRANDYTPDLTVATTRQTGQPRDPYEY